MELYEFEKSLTTRYDEFFDILQWQNSAISASEIRAQWSYYIEIAVEPRGWQALWKIPRVICEESKIRFPTVVLGIVDQVFFKELKASFIITGVEEDDVDLPENQEVLLEDLWVTKDQENSAIDIEKTANCIDQLRFFYKNIWMPWDSDSDDLDWTKKHLKSRIRFYDDVNKVNMKQSVANHIKILLLEARYIQRKCDYLEMVLDDNENDESIIDNNISKEQITDLMKLNLRMATIKAEIELLENPVMRKVYEDMKINSDVLYNNGIVYIITMMNTIRKQINILKTIEDSITDEQPVLMLNSLQEALDVLKPSDQIILTSGEHHIKFVENLNNGLITGLNNNDNHKAVLKSKDDDILLITIAGHFVLKNVILDCRNVRNGICIKSGDVTMENCEIIGDNLSSTKKGIVLIGNSKLALNNCTIRNFGIGLSLNGLSTAHLNQSNIFNCKIGIELEDNTHITFDENAGCSVKNSESYGIWFGTKLFHENVSPKKIVLNDTNELKKDYLSDLPWTGNCTFENNKKGNVIIWNRNMTFSNSLLSTPSNWDGFQDIIDISTSSYETITDDNDCSTLSTSEDKIIPVDDSVICLDD